MKIGEKPLQVQSEMHNGHIAQIAAKARSEDAPLRGTNCGLVLEERGDGWWHLPDRFVQIPLMFSLVATILNPRPTHA